MLPQIVLVVHTFLPDAKITSEQVRGNVATVSFVHAKVEGSDYSGRILLHRYPFGWQAVSMAGGHEAFRAGELHDIGPANDVTAVRSMMANLYHGRQIIGPVHVVKNYALATWWGFGGGEALFKKTGKDWTVVTKGGGSLDAAGLRSYGVPAAVASEIIHE